jgi:23S rRNA (pseudouridine1915-N3)-methyltransferase
MAMLFLFVGKTKEGFIREGIEKYATLAGRYTRVETRELKGHGRGPGPDAVAGEGETLLSRIGPDDFLFALDERGVNPTSVEFADRLGGLLDLGRRMVFAVGGPFGISDAVRSRADMALSLSKMTFTHEMARLVLMEQVYRALTIIKGKTYHY